MAIMIPDKPREGFKENSLEDKMFEALSKMSDDFYVVHSFKNTYVKDNVLYEGETDFVVFNRFYGVLCIEAKAGQVFYRDGKWKYANGDDMKHNGPYNQASENKWDFLETIKSSSISYIKNRCKLMHAVWFPSIPKSKLYTNSFPAEFDRNLTMTMEDLVNPEETIVGIFNIELEKDIKTDLSEEDAKRLLREIICPEFQIFPSRNFDVDLKKITFHRLIKEQANILKYIRDQRTAVINGAAGTGKTMIAVEKATYEASKGGKVLFLCYNVMLKEHLAKDYAYNGIEYMTLDSFICKICDTKEPDYLKARERLEDMYLTGVFPYDHVIVDEGQDFGKEKIEEADILQVIHDAVVDNDNNGTFYVFYDKLQIVQSERLPQYIADADCKLTLYKNCRNTENIAITSLKPIIERSPRLIEGAIKGTPATVHFGKDIESQLSILNETIDSLKKVGLQEIEIITCETEKTSILNGKIKDGKYKKIPFATCRRFKGLEADAVILIDVNRDTFKEKSIERFYVGTSRAKLRLDIITAMDDNECAEVLSEVLKYTKRIKNPKRELATSLNAMSDIRE